ncbi:phosphopantothenoylcysteine decarboxylase domain-containing protein [Caproiciproducens faecalis]|uniref:Phosphopantothenate--cysteine ligase n=1 Tax=Caproiciproducens faecalis TaxID=2820301 RepID=A0ABS7DJK1_9FIRM|nr:phosphopantothenoylcysteine decarboxylase [Caproiciproducens faecalis]MBW7571462.1 phosphopantothenate--cysteine ligase [Caproiciproducens faecalis]
MNFIVTAGGTRERIDAVRTIANEATGKLGSLIADELNSRLAGQEHTVYYLCGTGSCLPNTQDGNIRVIPIEGTDSLQETLIGLLKEKKISAVIHSMAVSDYKVSCVTTPEQIANALAEKFRSAAAPHTEKEWEQAVREAFFSSPISAKHKISSDLKHPALVLEKTPKIIGLIKDASPQTLLVGFKLLSGVSRKVLIDTAYHQLKKNRCTYVLANDMDSIEKGNHEGFLVDESGNYTAYSGKEQIAKGVADSVLKKLMEVKK